MSEPVIAYIRVEDVDYPRNVLLRAALASRFSVRVVVRSTRGNVLARYLRDLLAIWRNTTGVTLIVVAEFSLPFVPIAWCIARARRARLVVDGFVGRHETVIGDWARSSPHSLRSLFAGFVDLVAVHLADLVLIDTEVRARRLREAHRLRASRVLAIAVGAPSWAKSTPARAPQDDPEPLQVLYYGWYIPLHGVPTVIEALAATSRDVRLTLVGEADHAGGVRDMRALARSLAVDGRCRFIDSAVSSAILADLAADADVVLGVFGGSVKAAGVIPNKVWQGLAMGRRVVTRRSPALEALARSIPEGQLVTVPPEEPKALAHALDALADAPRTAYLGTRSIIDDLVERDCAVFLSVVDGLVRRD